MPDPLRPYRERRNFDRTAEPEGGPLPAEAPVSDQAAGPRFVVQKHAARRLHYDLRLELDGVLKSWAVTRGPSLDPAERRLAVHVEDHPLDYGDFEGIIPAGEYGGGTVLLWDRGRWEPVGDARAGYAAGKLKFRLHGDKLRGGWTLVRMHGTRERGRSGGRSTPQDTWLLIKERDDQAHPAAERDLLEERPDSVASGRTLDEVAKQPDAVWHSDAGAALGPLPGFIEPQLARRVERPPEGDAWLHEIKFDGYRVQLRLDAGRVQLLTRTGLDWTERFGPIARAAAALPAHQAVVDGEVVVLEAGGGSSFAALQEALSLGASDRMVYHAFDLLLLDGRDLRERTLEERKSALERLLAPPGRGDPGSGAGPTAGPGVLRFTEHLVGQGGAFFRSACRYGLEGVVCKRRDAPYRSGRGGDWLKVKCLERQEFVVVGWTRASSGGRGLGALVLGAHREAGGPLLYVGRVGTGFSERLAGQLRELLEARPRAACPLDDDVPAPARRGVTWVEPVLVCAVEFTGWTADRRLRHPSFQGLREDRPAAEVVLEEEVPPQLDGPGPTGPKTEEAGGAGAAEEEGDRVAGVTLTHPDRVLWAGQGLSKRGLVDYYRQVAPFMLPELVDRPLSLLRCPSGQAEQCFFQKHPAKGSPPQLRRVSPGAAIGDPEEYLVVDDLAGLVALAQLGVLELHPWGARASAPESPDRMIVDLDPGPEVAWEELVAATREVRRRLAERGLVSFLKATGGKGLHVVVPLTPGQQSWAQVKQFGRTLVEQMVRESPQRYTASMVKQARQGRIYLDYLRNDQGSTAVAGYSPRARPGAPVAVPLAWEELDQPLRSDHFTVASVPRRLAALEVDPWAGLAELRQTLGDQTGDGELPEREEGKETNRRGRSAKFQSMKTGK